MKWLNPGEVEIALRGCEMEPQTFVLPSDVEDLTTQLSTEPRRISTDEGVAWPTKEWVGLIDARPVVVQQESCFDSCSTHSVIVLTPYIRKQDGVEEWEALRELAELPRPIRASRPLYIQSHTASGDHVVCRPDEQGWFYAIYRAQSSNEARSLLSYLQLIDPWNKNCFIGKKEKPGEWTIVTGNGHKRRLLGNYPEVDSAIRVALKLSSNLPDDVLIVKNLSEKQRSREYRIVRGQVERATEL